MTPSSCLPPQHNIRQLEYLLEVALLDDESICVLPLLVIQRRLLSVVEAVTVPLLCIRIYRHDLLLKLDKWAEKRADLRTQPHP